MRKKKPFEITDRIDLVLRNALHESVCVKYREEDSPDCIRLLDQIVAMMKIDGEWAKFKETFRSQVENEAKEALDKIKTSIARERDQLAEERKHWRENIDDLEKMKKEWIDSNDAFKETRSLIELVDVVFDGDSDTISHRLDCKKAIFNRVLRGLDERAREER